MEQFSGKTVLFAHIDDAVGFAVAKQMVSGGAKVVSMSPISSTIDDSLLRREPQIVNLIMDGCNEKLLEGVPAPGAT